MCIEQYKSRENFLALFEPSKQYAYTKDLRRAFMGNAPALGTLSKAFGENTTIAWLEFQLIDLSEFSGCKDKLTTFQLDSIAQVIMATWGYLKVTELMLFFLQFKAGKYGKFYGAVDGLAITEALQEFARERYDLVSRYQREDEAQQRAEEDARHDAEVKQFRAALSISNMTIPEWHDIYQEYNLSVEEIAEIGWLFRISLGRSKIDKIDTPSGRKL